MRNYLIACCVAALIPFFAGPAQEEHPAFPGWPTEIAGLELTPVEAREEDRGFELSYDGRFARFQAGEHHVLLWWIARPSRRVHSIRDCYRGLGYAIRPEGETKVLDGRPWGTFLAERAGERLRVYERVEDADGRVFTNVSAWYWSTLLGRSRTPTWACALVTRGNDSIQERP